MKTNATAKVPLTKGKKRVQFHLDADAQEVQVVVPATFKAVKVSLPELESAVEDMREIVERLAGRRRD